MFVDACSRGAVHKAILLVQKGANAWERGVAAACNKGYETIAPLMLSRKFTDLGDIDHLANIGLEVACKAGYLNIVLFMIEKGANEWNRGLYGACYGGYNDIALLMIEKGANDWNRGLWNACQGGHIDLVYLMTEKGANSWNEGLVCACQRGHIDIASFMIEKDPSYKNLGLSYACLGGHKDLALLLIKKGANNWDWGLECACKGGHKELILMIKKGANIDRSSSLSNDDIFYLLKHGVKHFGGYKPIVDYWNKWMVRTRLDLGDLMIPDLVEIVVSS